MARRQVYHDEEILQWYENAIDRENVRREQKGLVALNELDLLRIVLARFAGLPVTHDVDLGVVRGSKDGFWTPPKTKKDPAKQAKRTSKKAPATAERWTPPHGG